jgi:hypothetical protein
MNLPAYRRALRMAHEEYQQEVNAATDRLMKALAVADEKFHEDQETAKAVEG